MTLLEKYDRYVKLWRVALPHVAEPSIQDAARWSDYPPEIVEKAILRTARRFAPGKLPPTFQSLEAHKYVSAVAKGESTNDTRSGNR
jgi:hypothetical protein